MLRSDAGQQFLKIDVRRKRKMEFYSEFDVPARVLLIRIGAVARLSRRVRRTRVVMLYSNRVAVVVEQPVVINVPSGAYTSEVPAEVYWSPFESNSASWVIFIKPV